MRIRGGHDAATHTTTYNVSVDSSAGPDFSYVQVSTYPSAAAFVDEIKVLPPLTLSSGTKGSGGVTFALTNEFDAQQRLTRVTNMAGGSTIVTTYTAWDSDGRPTSGSMSTGGGFTISYDDAARTATPRRSIGNETTSYDENGNVSQTVQAYGGSRVTTATKVVSTARVCK